MGKWIRGTETVQGARKTLPSSEGASRRSVQSGHVGHQSAQQKRRPVCSTQAATGCDRFPLAFNVAEMQTIFVNRPEYAIQIHPAKKRAGLTCKFQISQRRRRKRRPRYAVKVAAIRRACPQCCMSKLLAHGHTGGSGSTESDRRCPRRVRSFRIEAPRPCGHRLVSPASATHSFAYRAPRPAAFRSSCRTPGSLPSDSGGKVHSPSVWPVAIRITLTALPITSAGRFRRPLGIRARLRLGGNQSAT
jgi:hypothetical protein